MLDLDLDQVLIQYFDLQGVKHLMKQNNSDVERLVSVFLDEVKVAVQPNPHNFFEQWISIARIG